MKISTNGAKIHHNLGIFYRKLGRLEGAISQHKKALSINPDYPGAHYNPGLMYGGKGFFSLAADHLYRAGVLFLQQDDGKGAIKSFEGLKQTKSKELEQTLFEKLYSQKAEKVNL